MSNLARAASSINAPTPSRMAGFVSDSLILSLILMIRNLNDENAMKAAADSLRRGGSAQVEAVAWQEGGSNVVSREWPGIDGWGNGVAVGEWLQASHRRERHSMGKVA